MKLDRIADRIVLLRSDRDELTILVNALNLLVNGLDLPDLTTMLGCSAEEAQALLDDLTRILDTLPPPTAVA
jgi:hypothetical protein